MQVIRAGLIIAARLHMPDNNRSVRRETELIRQRLNGIFELLARRNFPGRNNEVAEAEGPPPFPRISHHVEDIFLASAQNFDAFVVLASEDVLRQALRALCSRDAEALDNHRSGPALWGQDEFQPYENGLHPFLGGSHRFEQRFRVGDATHFG